PQIEIGVGRKRNEFRSTAFDAVAVGAPRQEGNLVAFGEQYARDCKQRIEMARRGRGSEENFHGIGPLIVDRLRSPHREVARLTEMKSRYRRYILTSVPCKMVTAATHRGIAGAWRRLSQRSNTFVKYEPVHSRSSPLMRSDHRRITKCDGSHGRTHE